MSIGSERTSHVERADIRNNVAIEQINPIPRTAWQGGDILPDPDQFSKEIDRRSHRGEIRSGLVAVRTGIGAHRHLHLPNIQNAAGSIRTVPPTTCSHEKHSDQGEHHQDDHRQFHQGHSSTPARVPLIG